MEKNTRLELRVSPKLKADLKRFAKDDRRSLSDSVRLALAQYVEDRKTWEPK
jgi:predicted transcriptional regulator